MNLLDAEKGKEVTITEIQWSMDPNIAKMIVQLGTRGFVEGATVKITEKMKTGSLCSVEGQSFFIDKEALHCFRVHSKYKRPKN